VTISLVAIYGAGFLVTWVLLAMWGIDRWGANDAFATGVWAMMGAFFWPVILPGVVMGGLLRAWSR